MNIDRKQIVQIIKTELQELGMFQLSISIGSLIKKIEYVNDPNFSTIGINDKGCLYINKSFLKKIKNTKFLVFVLLHEILHPVFGDTAKMKLIEPKVRPIANIAMDARINSFLYSLFSQEQEINEGFKNLYNKATIKNPILSLVSPVHKKNAKSYLRMWNTIWCTGNGQKKYTYEQIFELIIDNIDTVKKEVQQLLIGSIHNKSIKDKISSKKCKEIHEYIKTDIKNSNIHNSIKGKLINILENQSIINTNILKKYATSKSKNKIKSFFNLPSRQIHTPVPIKPCNKDIFMTAMGHTPIFWKNTVSSKKQTSFNLAIYMDVSGSYINKTPQVAGLLSRLDRSLKEIFCFSNIIDTISMDDLRTSNVKTTYGTDFNCVAEHIIENNFNSIIIFTDGYANIRTNLANKLKGQLKKCMVIFLDDSRTKDNFFSNNYDSCNLKDII
jgi:hypothetical protein